jgi:hypothetical protein
MTWPSEITHPHCEKQEDREKVHTGLGIGNDENASSKYGSSQNLFLQLSHVLQGEISNHMQTREELNREIARRSELEVQVWRQSQEICQWQSHSQSVYRSLDEHRTESTWLKQQLETATMELKTLKEVRVQTTNNLRTSDVKQQHQQHQQHVASPPEGHDGSLVHVDAVSPVYEFPNISPSRTVKRNLRPRMQSQRDEEEEGADGGIWRLDVLQHVEEYLRGQSE